MALHWHWEILLGFEPQHILVTELLWCSLLSTSLLPDSPILKCLWKKINHPMISFIDMWLKKTIWSIGTLLNIYTKRHIKKSFFINKILKLFRISNNLVFAPSLSWRVISASCPNMGNALQPSVWIVGENDTNGRNLQLYRQNQIILSLTIQGKNNPLGSIY